MAAPKGTTQAGVTGLSSDSLPKRKEREISSQGRGESRVRRLESGSVLPYKAGSNNPLLTSASQGAATDTRGLGADASRNGLDHRVIDLVF